MLSRHFKGWHREVMREIDETPEMKRLSSICVFCTVREICKRCKVYKEMVELIGQERQSA